VSSSLVFCLKCGGYESSRSEPTVSLQSRKSAILKMPKQSVELRQTEKSGDYNLKSLHKAHTRYHKISEINRFQNSVFASTDPLSLNAGQTIGKKFVMWPQTAEKQKSCEAQRAKEQLHCQWFCFHWDHLNSQPFHSQHCELLQIRTSSMLRVRMRTTGVLISASVVSSHAESSCCFRDKDDQLLLLKKNNSWLPG